MIALASLRGLLLAAGGAVLLAGCANQQCDPNADRSIFQVAGCVAGGGYQQRQDRLRIQAEQAEADVAQADRDRQAALQRRDQAAGQAAALRGELATQRSRSIALEREIAGARERTRVNQQSLARLEQDLAALRAEEERLRSAGGVSPQDRQALDSLRQQQQRLRGDWQRLREAAPRD